MSIEMMLVLYYEDHEECETHVVAVSDFVVPLLEAAVEEYNTWGLDEPWPEHDDDEESEGGWIATTGSCDWYIDSVEVV